MSKIAVVLLIIGIFLISGCIQFKEVSLSPSTIKGSEKAMLWIDIENSDQDKINGTITFEYGSGVYITKDGKEITAYPFGIEGKGGTLGRLSFDVSGQNIQGQPNSPWNIKVYIKVGQDIRDKRELTLTVLP